MDDRRRRRRRRRRGHIRLVVGTTTDVEYNNKYQT